MKNLGCWSHSERKRPAAWRGPCWSLVCSAVTFVAGFDLDLTLVDSADGIAATFVQASAGVGVAIEPADVRPLIGLPLEDTMRRLVPDQKIDQAVRLYRELYPSVGVPVSVALPGAREAIAAVREHGGKAVVISAKVESAARLLLEHVELNVDEVLGSRFAEQKGVALRERGAELYVGDHPADMAGAHSAEVHAVGVTTGFHDPPALREAGADVVLTDLLGFPSWFANFLAGR